MRDTKLPIRNVRYMAAFGGDPDIEPTRRMTEADPVQNLGRQKARVV